MSSLSSFYLCNTGYCIDSFECMRLPPERTLFAIVDLVAICLSSLNVFEDHVLYLARFQVVSTCVNLLSLPNKSHDIPHDLHRLFD